MKLLIVLLIALSSCQGRFNHKKTTYQLNGIIPKVVTVPRHKMSPVDTSAADLADRGVLRVRYGLSIVLVAFAVSIMFANPLTARLSNYGIIGGAFLAGDGFLLIFMAEYLMWFCVVVLLMFGVLIWARKKSIVTLCKGIKDKCTSQKKP